MVSTVPAPAGDTGEESRRLQWAGVLFRADLHGELFNLVRATSKLYQHLLSLSQRRKLEWDLIGDPKSRVLISVTEDDLPEDLFYQLIAAADRFRTFVSDAGFRFARDSSSPVGTHSSPTQPSQDCAPHPTGEEPHPNPPTEPEVVIKPVVYFEAYKALAAVEKNHSDIEPLNYAQAKAVANVVGEYLARTLKEDGLRVVLPIRALVRAYTAIDKLEEHPIAGMPDLWMRTIAAVEALKPELLALLSERDRMKFDFLPPTAVPDEVCAIDVDFEPVIQLASTDQPAGGDR